MSPVHARQGLAETAVVDDAYEAFALRPGTLRRYLRMRKLSGAEIAVNLLLNIGLVQSGHFPSVCGTCALCPCWLWIGTV